jgi:hypothetical protein
VAFTRRLQRYPSLELADERPAWRPLINLRGLQSLRLRPVQASAAGSPASA